MVLASVDDHQKQEQTWAALPSWNRRPDYLRQLLTRRDRVRPRYRRQVRDPQRPMRKAGGALGATSSATTTRRSSIRPIGKSWRP